MNKRALSYARAIQIDSAALFAFEHVLVQDYVFRLIDQRWTSFTGVHYLFSEFEKGKKELYGAFDKMHNVLGFVFGNIEDDSFYGHLMFLRDANALECVNLISSIIKAKHKDLKKFIAQIPVNHWAAMRVAKRFGCIESECPDLFFFDGKKMLKCKQFTKEI